MKLVKQTIIATAVVLSMLPMPVVAAPQAVEAHYLYLGNDHPNEDPTYWSEDVQGISHDADHWFITQTLDLWKIPVGDNLVANNPGPGVLHRRFLDYPILFFEGYDHFGDLTQHQFDGRGWLFIPITAGSTQAVAVFNSDTLAYIDHELVQQASWAALDPDHFLYVGVTQNGRAMVYRYAIEWQALVDSGDLILSDETPIPLLRGDGSTLRLEHMQGGVFSPSGDLLYMVTGFIGVNRNVHGIHVFDTSSWKRVQKSTNGYGHFNYEFEPGFEWEEPEGVTIWDLDDGRAPGIRGQLHVILLDNDFPSDDDVYLKNYTGTIYVDGAFQGVPTGTPNRPFPLVNMANNLAWDGARISIRAGSYPETLTISQRVRIVATGGVARIGD